jgi:probable rRNA maturation factor
MPVHLSGPPEGLRGSRADARLLLGRARIALAALGLSRSELSIALVDDREISRLNGEWRGRPTPTDVLSFSLVEGDFSEHRGGLLGDVVISVETAARQAAERRRGLDDELARLLVHGLLHLVGHDHEADDEARAMAAEERRLRRAIREAGARSRTAT